MSAHRVFLLEQALKKFTEIKTQEDFVEAKLEAEKVLSKARKIFDPAKIIIEAEVYTRAEAIIRAALSPSGPWQTRDIIAAVGMVNVTHTDRVHAGLILKAAGFNFTNRYDKDRKMPVKKWVIQWEFKKAPVEQLYLMAREKLKEKIPAAEKKSRSKFESLI